MKKDPPKDETPLSRLEQQAIELETIDKLSALTRRCLENKVAYSVVVVPGAHPGKTLCAVAEEHAAHHLLVGRRNLSHLKRYDSTPLPNQWLIKVIQDAHCVHFKGMLNNSWCR